MNTQYEQLRSMAEDALAHCLPAGEPYAKVLTESAAYSLMAGGKRLRPVLVLAAAQSMGVTPEEALPYACAIEMIHTYSLIHDDLPCMDDDDMRRGKPTNHKVFGEAIALLAGDALLTGAFEAAASNSLVGAEIPAKAVAYLAGCAGRYGMIGGQIMDLEGEKRSLSVDELLKLHSLKTGALISAAAVLGALAAGVTFTDPRMEAVVMYAENIGLSFQIIDDILDCTGDAEILGKSVGVDAERQKTTFMSFYSVDEAKFYAERLTDEAIRAIRNFENSDALITLAKWLLTRRK
jgi:geranylgeranyl diphosphate synthase type II